MPSGDSLSQNPETWTASGKFRPSVPSTTIAKYFSTSSFIWLKIRKKKSLVVCTYSVSRCLHLYQSQLHLKEPVFLHFHRTCREFLWNMCRPSKFSLTHCSGTIVVLLWQQQSSRIGTGATFLVSPFNQGLVTNLTSPIWHDLYRYLFDIMPKSDLER